jgi:bifunctional NMN adenylyltransferase/nudix hydrolase
MKDGNDYLKWFPMFFFMNVDQKEGALSATSVRTLMMEMKSPTIPATVQADYDYYKNEAIKFSGYPFPETLNFNCADAILECSGHILLIERKFAPGAGSMALPGGFKNRNETFFDCAVRELMEETNVRVPEKVLRGSVVDTKLFDSPNRSHGIPRNTLAVHFKIARDSDGGLPRANGSDDASKAIWVPIVDVLNTVPMYDDHKDIISTMLGVMPAPAF